MFRWAFVSISILLSGCANQPTDHTGAYIVEFPKKVGEKQFFPTVVSGNGDVVVGLYTGGRGLWAWTRTGGVKKLVDAPVGEILSPTSVDFDGDAVVGSIGLVGPMMSLGSAGIFLWSEKQGLQILSSGPSPNTGSLPPLEISNDGQSVVFDCPNGNPPIPTCRGTTSFPIDWPSMARIWTPTKGFQILGANVAQKFDYITTAGDFRSYIIGRTGVGKNLATMGRLDSTGHYTPFKNIPFGFDPKVGAVLSNNADFAAAPYEGFGHDSLLLWDKEGRLISPLKFPGECGPFIFPTAIDDSGALFGADFACPYPMGIPGLRITSAGPETIGEWLRKAGLPNQLPPDTIVWSVSDDGKTIYGEVHPPHVAVSGLNPPPRIIFVDDPSETDESQSYNFIAHVP